MAIQVGGITVIDDDRNLVNIASGAGGASSSTIQVFTSSGTWTKPSGCTKVKVFVTGGGGGGHTATGTDGASGGSAGGTAIEYIDVTSVSSVSVTVGSGGAAAANGGASSFGAYCTGNGGLAGINDDAPGPAGGTASGGDINIQGGDGPTPTASYLATSGGTSYWGGGGAGERGANGSSGKAYGSGGGGGSSGGSGASGKSGIVVVEEWY